MLLAEAIGTDFFRAVLQGLPPVQPQIVQAPQAPASPPAAEAPAAQPPAAQQVEASPPQTAAPEQAQQQTEPEPTAEASPQAQADSQQAQAAPVPAQARTAARGGNPYVEPPHVISAGELGTEPQPLPPATSASVTSLIQDCSNAAR